MKKARYCLLLIALGTAGLTCSAANAARVTAVSKLPAVKILEANSPGRLLRASSGDMYQWPGLYFEARFAGPSVFFKLGTGDVILRVLVDGEPVATLVKPARRLLRDRRSRETEAHGTDRDTDRKPGRTECIRRISPFEEDQAVIGATTNPPDRIHWRLAHRRLRQYLRDA